MSTAEPLYVSSSERDAVYISSSVLRGAPDVPKIPRGRWEVVWGKVDGESVAYARILHFPNVTAECFLTYRAGRWHPRVIITDTRFWVSATYDLPSTPDRRRASKNIGKFLAFRTDRLGSRERLACRSIPW
jgi:hypothetical protein